MTYTYTTLDDPLGVGPYGTVFYGINDIGQVVGDYWDGSVGHGFLYSAGTYTTLSDPLGTATFAFGINNLGQVVGKYFNGSGAHIFIYSGGTYTTLNDPYGAGGSLGTNVLGINDSDQIVGSYLDSGGVRHGFLYNNGSYTTLDDPLAGAIGTEANGINDAGQIVGEYWDSNNVLHGFLYSGGTYTTLNTSNAYDINDLGQIVGVSFLYDGTTYAPLADPVATSGTFPLGINNTDQIVGFYANSSGQHGFLAAETSIQPNVRLTDHNLVVEMAELANEAYGNSADPAVQRNWHAVSAAELNLHANGISGGVSYTFRNGLYEAAIPAVPGAHASALVLEGMIDGVKTLTIAFRGTDDFGDVINWPSAHAYFVDFSPLILSLRDYIAANGVQQVLATGHSLGGSMVQDLLATDIGIGIGSESGYTWGSPGSDLHPTNPHLVNFVHPTDPVSTFGGLVGDVRVGTDVVLHSPFVSNSLFDKIGGLAHRMDIYFADTLDLADLARSSDIFESRPEGVAIQTGNFWTGNVNSFQVLAGTDHNDDVHISSSDKFVLGAAGDDTFRWDIRNSNAPPVIIDGGPGIDALFLSGSSNAWDLVTNGAETNLYFKPTHSLVAELFGIESVHFQSGAIAQIRQPLLAGNNSVDNPVHDSPSIAGLHSLGHNDGWLFS